MRKQIKKEGGRKDKDMYMKRKKKRPRKNELRMQ